MDYRFKDKRYRAGSSDTAVPEFRPAAYAADGIAIPIDYIPNRRGSVLASQVLLVDDRVGQLLFAYPIYLDTDARDRRGRRRRYSYNRDPVQVELREGTVLVLKRSDLHVIQGDRAGD